VIKISLTKSTSRLFVEDFFPYRRSKLFILTLVLILVLATLNLVAIKAVAVDYIPAAARLIGDGRGSIVSFTADANCNGGMRGVTSDGTYVYFRTDAGDYICRVSLSGGAATAYGPIKYNNSYSLSSLGTGQKALTISNGCIFIRDSLTYGSTVRCIDIATMATNPTYSMSNTISVTGLEIPQGGGWLSGNLMNFPDGRVGALSIYSTSPKSASVSGFYTDASNPLDTSQAPACPTGQYCKILRLYTVTRTGTWPTLSWSQDITLADTEGSWPSDDHGMATDGTYLYQIRHEAGYKVWKLISGTAASVVFNGDSPSTPQVGNQNCSAPSPGPVSTTNIGGKCNIFYPKDTSVARLSNATFIGRSHSTNQYIIGDYGSGLRFYKSYSEAPAAAGPGTTLTITAITNKLYLRGSTTAVATASSGTPTYSAFGACSVNSTTGVVTFTSTGDCKITASVGTSPDIKTADTTFKIVPNITQILISRTGIQPNALSSYIPPPYLSTSETYTVTSCISIVGATGADLLSSTNLSFSLASLLVSPGVITDTGAGKSYTITGTLAQVQAAFSIFRLTSTSGRIMAANSGSIYLRARTNLVVDSATDTGCIDYNDARIQLYQYTSDQIRRKNVPQKSGSTP